MKESMKNKAKKFWAKHKWTIISVVAVLGCAGYAYAKYHNVHLSDEEIEQNGRLVDAKPSDKEIAEALATVANNEIDAYWDRRQKDPKYQLANGGWITDDYEMEDFKTTDGQTITCVEMIINDLPVENLGIFGEDVQKKLNELYPDHKAVTDVSMIVDFRHDPSFKKEEPAA